jgi:hypothetical protein
MVYLSFRAVVPGELHGLLGVAREQRLRLCGFNETSVLKLSHDLLRLGAVWVP